MRSSKPISSDFFSSNDVVSIARSLIGKWLITEHDGERTSGIIVETEAYSGTNDKACHANNKKRTPRTATMFLPGGHTYVYLCYGLHHLFNIVTNVEGEPDAVLIRAIQPMEGVERMASRRNLPGNSIRLTKGPACLSQALGINQTYNALNLADGKTIWLEDRQDWPKDWTIAQTTRIGVDYAGEDALKLWRFFVQDNPWVSMIAKKSS